MSLGSAGVGSSSGGVVECGASVLALTVAGSVVARTSVPASGFMPRVPAPLADKACFRQIRKLLLW